MNIPTTESASSSFQSGKGADSRPLTDGKIVSNYQFGLPGATNVANKNDQRHSPTPVFFDKPENRGSAIPRSGEMKVTPPSSPGH